MLRIEGEEKVFLIQSGNLIFMDKFYVHSLKDKLKSEWQTLEIHLKNVAELAWQFTEFFNAGEWGYLAGMNYKNGIKTKGV